MTLNRQKMDGADLDAVVQEILNSSRQALVAHGFVQSHGSISEYSIEINQVERSWTLSAFGGSRVVQHDKGVTSDVDGPRPSDIEDAPFPVRLAFPDRLYLWGRPSDDFAPIGAELINDRWVLVTAENRTDPAILATITYDRSEQLITRVVRPTDIVELVVLEGTPPPDLESTLEGLVFSPRYEARRTAKMGRPVRSEVTFSGRGLTLA